MSKLDTLSAPWNGKGSTWAKAAKLNWEVERASVHYPVRGKMREWEAKHVLFRSDTGNPLGSVSRRYKLVQPAEVLEVYQGIVRDTPFDMEVAGELYGGQRIFALARAREDIRVMGTDVLRPYLLFATSYDGMMSSVCLLSTLRLFCMNMLPAIFAGGGQYFQVPHSTDVDFDKMREKLGLTKGGRAQEEFAKLEDDINKLAKVKVSEEEAVRFFVRLVSKNKEVKLDENSAFSRTVHTMINLYKEGPGADARSAKGTLWGVVNAVTRFADHETKARSADARISSAWFGEHSNMKKVAFETALKLAA